MFSKGLAGLQGLAALTGADGIVYKPGRLRASRVGLVAVWHTGRGGEAARSFAETNGLACVVLDDGFLSAIGRPRSTRPIISLVADDLGDHHDPEAPSRIEWILKNTDFASMPGLIERAERICRRIEQLEPRTDPHGDQRAVLVLANGGQTPDQDDPVPRLVALARREHPGAEIWLRLANAGPPSLDLTNDEDIRVIPPGTGIGRVLDKMRHVYADSAIGGLEAVLRGLPVTLTGRPFYAGWGLTDDRGGPLPRRGRALSRAELAAGALLLYPHYRNPWDDRPSSAEEAFEALETLEAAARRARPTICVGVRRWKRAALTELLGAGTVPVAFRSDPYAALAEAQATGARLAVWASKEPAGLASAAAAASVPFCRIEDGFLRSAGLGCVLTPPSSIVCDERGIHYDKSQPSDLESTIERGDFPPEMLARAERLIARIRATRIGKYGMLGDGAADGWPPPDPKDERRRVLVIGQVADDDSIRRGSVGITTNTDLLAAVRQLRPEALIAWRPHPDVSNGLRSGAIPRAEALRYADLVIERASADAAIAGADEVHVLTSLTGFEALLRGKAVVCHGVPFYAGWGLTHDLVAPDLGGAGARRRRRATLAELAAAALIAHPLYRDPDTGLPAPPELVIDRIAGAKPAARGLVRRIMRFRHLLGIAWKGLLHRPRQRR